MAERFTPFYEWAAEWPQLSLPEALVLCRIKMWGNAGCFEKYSTLAEKLKLGQRTVIRAVVSLRKKELIKVSYLDKARQKRILKFNFERTNLPIIDQKPMPQRHRNTARKSKTYARAAQQPMPERHNTISCTKQDNKIKETADLLADVLTTHEAKPLSQTEFQNRKQRQLQSLSNLTSDQPTKRNQ